MSLRLPRLLLLTAVAAAALLPAEAARAQLKLRGTQDDTELTVKGEVAPQPPPIKLKKPPRVTRIRSQPPPALRTIDDLATQDPAAARPAVDTGAPDPAAPLPAPKLDTDPPSLRRKPRPVEEDPYAALGIDLGSFLLKPSIEVDFGYDDNPGRQPGDVKGSPFSTVTPKLEFASTWSRSELRGSITGGLTRYFEVDDNRPTLNALLDGRLDVSRDTSLDAEGRFVLDTERLGSDGVSASATKRPVTLAYGGTLGVTQAFGDASLRLRGSVDRNEYQMTPGSSVSRNYNTYGLALRAGYEITPALKPFVELDADQRVHDDRFDSAGIRRDSHGLTGLAGLTFELDGALKGEVSAGYGERHYEDPSLDRLRGVITNASLVWTPSALTTVTLTGTTAFNESSITGASGSISRQIGVDIAHSFRRNLIGTAALTQTTTDYQGVSQTEHLWDATVGLEYKFTRSVSVKASYAYEHLASTVPGADYTANTVMLGLKLQR